MTISAPVIAIAQPLAAEIASKPYTVTSNMFMFLNELTLFSTTPYEKCQRLRENDRKIRNFLTKYIEVFMKDRPIEQFDGAYLSNCSESRVH